MESALSTVKGRYWPQAEGDVICLGIREYDLSRRAKTATLVVISGQKYD